MTYIKIIPILIMSLALAACGNQTDPGLPPQRAPVDVTTGTATVVRANLIYTTVQSAVVKPRVMQNLVFGISGSLTAIHAGMNDFIRQGGLLAVLDPADHLARIARSEIDMQILEIRKLQREVEATNVSNNLTAAMNAYNSAVREYNAVPSAANLQARERASATYQQAQWSSELFRLNSLIFDQDYERAHEAHELLVGNLDSAILAAPTNGFILFDATISVGDRAEPNTPLFSFVRSADLLLHISSREAMHLRGQERIIVVIENVSYEAYAYEPVRGDAVWATSIPVTQVYLAFRQAPDDVPSGSTVSAGITIEKTDALAVPRRSIRSIGGVATVEILEGDLVVSVPVQTGIVSGDLVEIISGLSEGDTIIVG